MESVNEAVNLAIAKGRSKSFMCRSSSPEMPIIRAPKSVPVITKNVTPTEEAR